MGAQEKRESSDAMWVKASRQSLSYNFELYLNAIDGRDSAGNICIDPYRLSAGRLVGLNGVIQAVNDLRGQGENVEPSIVEIIEKGIQDYIEHLDKLIIDLMHLGARAPGIYPFNVINAVGISLKATKK